MISQGLKERLKPLFNNSLEDVEAYLDKSNSKFGGLSLVEADQQGVYQYQTTRTASEYLEAQLKRHKL